MSEFNVAKELRAAVSAIVAKMGEYSLDQLDALDAAERARGAQARSSLLVPLQAEIEARMLNAPTVLSPASIALIAKGAHEMNAAYCRAIGDDSQTAWDDAPDWQRSSAVKGVEFHLANPAAGPEASHESWLAEKEADGWVFGETKDPAKKEHPCMVPFAALPVEQQAKDTLFRQTIHTLAPVFLQVEQLARLADPLVPAAEVVGPGETATGKKPAAVAIDAVAELAFCAEGRTVCFKRPVEPGDFETRGQKAVFLREVAITADMEPARVSEVVALDAQGKPVASVGWTVPLEGGAGRKAMFPVGAIAFDL